MKYPKGPNSPLIKLEYLKKQTLPSFSSSKLSHLHWWCLINPNSVYMERKRFQSLFNNRTKSRMLIRNSLFFFFFRDCKKWHLTGNRCENWVKGPVMCRQLPRSSFLPRTLIFLWVFYRSTQHGICCGEQFLVLGATFEIYRILMEQRGSHAFLWGSCLSLSSFWVGRADWLLALGGPITVVYSVLIHTAAGSYVGPKQAP